jgi:WD40 repeat protein
LEELEPVKVLVHDNAVPTATIDADGNVIGSIGVDANLPVSAFVAQSELLDGYGRRTRYLSLPGLEKLATRKGVTFRAGIEAEVVNVKLSGGLLRRFRQDNGFEIAHSGAVNDVVFSPSERQIASAGGDCMVKLWDPSDGSYVRTLRRHEREVMCVLFSVDEVFLVSGGSDGIIFIWSLLDNAVIRSLRGHSDCIYSLAAKPDLSVIYSASHDKSIRTWHLNPRRPNAPLPPRVVGTTETTILLQWKAPAAFNEEITAFHLQYKVGLRNPWMPGELVVTHTY